MSKRERVGYIGEEQMIGRNEHFLMNMIKLFKNSDTNTDVCGSHKLFSLLTSL